MASASCRSCKVHPSAQVYKASQYRHPLTPCLFKEKVLAIQLRLSLIMVPTYQKPDRIASSAPEHNPEMSSLFAKRPGDETAEGFMREGQDPTPLSEPQEPHEWLPLTLRPSYLEFLIGVSFLLSIVVFHLTAKSLEDHGICDDNKSATTFFN